MVAREEPALEAFPLEVVERVEVALVAACVRQVKLAARTRVSISMSTLRIAELATNRVHRARRVATERVRRVARTQTVRRRITTALKARASSNVRRQKSIAALCARSSKQIRSIAVRAETIVCPGTHARVVFVSRVGRR